VSYHYRSRGPIPDDLHPAGLRIFSSRLSFSHAQKKKKKGGERGEDSVRTESIHHGNFAIEGREGMAGELVNRTNALACPSRHDGEEKKKREVAGAGSRSAIIEKRKERGVRGTPASRSVSEKEIRVAET